MFNLENKSVAVESEIYKGYYVIPNIDNYVINEYGHLILTKNSKYRKAGSSPKVNRSKRGYLKVTLYFVNGKKKKQYTVHRLVCLTFYGEPLAGQTDVNHIDGVKDNNYYKNLEWCTHQENVQHGYDTGLYSNKVLLSAYNVYTKELFSEYTLLRLSKISNINKWTIQHTLERKKFACTKNGWVFVYGNDLDLADLETRFHNFYSDICCYDVDNNVVTIASTAVELSFNIDLSKSMICKLLRNNKYRAKNYIIYYQCDKSEALKKLSIKYNFKLF